MSGKKSKKSAKETAKQDASKPETPEADANQDAKVVAKQPKALSRMNPNQKENIIVFMEEHYELLGATVSKLYSREVVERLWTELTQQLNDLGTIPKATSTWKKTWFDMKREVKAKLGPPPYPPQLMSPPDDQSTVGQRGRIAALMTQAVRICQQHAATSLDSLGSLQHPVAVDEDSHGESMEEARASSSPPVEISVKCEPPEFADFDLDEQPPVNDETAVLNGTIEDSAPAAKRPRVEMTQQRMTEVTFATALQMLAASQDRSALAMESMSEAARGLSEVFRRRTAVEIEKVEALKQIACAIRSRPF